MLLPEVVAPEPVEPLAPPVDEPVDALPVLEPLPVAEPPLPEALVPAPVLPDVPVAPLRLLAPDPLPMLAFVKMKRSLPLVPVLAEALVPALLEPEPALVLEPVLWSARWRHPTTVTV